MPRGNWRYIFAAIGLTVAIAGSAVGVYYLDNPVARQASAEQDHSPSNPKAPELQRIASALEAIEKGENSNENKQRARRDLDAQEGAWRWAKWAAWAAFVQLLLSGAGIAFVVQSLRQGQAGLGAARRALRHARVANNIAQETAKQQLRAYLDFESVGFCATDAHPAPEGQISTGVMLKIRNFGATPAEKVLLEYQIYITDAEHEPQLPGTPQTAEFVSISPDDHAAHRNFFHLPETFWPQIAVRKMNVMVTAKFAYLDAFKDSHTLGGTFVSGGTTDVFGAVAGSTYTSSAPSRVGTANDSESTA